MAKQTVQQKLEKQIKERKEQEKRDNIALDLTRQRKHAALFFQRPTPTIIASNSNNNQISSPAALVPGSTSPVKNTVSGSKTELNTPTKPHSKRHKPIIDDIDSSVKNIQVELERIFDGDEDNPPNRRDKGKGVERDQGGYVDEIEIRARQVESDRIKSQQLEVSRFRNSQYTVGDEIAQQLQLDDYKMDIDKVCNFLFDETQILLSNTGY